VKLLCAVVLVVAARPLAAQSSWQAFIGSLHDEAPPPTATQECFSAPMRPDSVWVVPDVDAISSVSVWDSDSRRWIRRTSTPYRGQPMAFRVSRMRCTSASQQPSLVYLERDNYTIALEQRDSVSPVQLLRVRSRGSGGDLMPLTYLLLDGRWMLTDTQSANDSLAQRRAEALERRQREADAAAREAERAVKRRRFLRMGWSPRTVDDVIDGYVQVGMTRAQVREAWGDPDLVSRSSNDERSSEQWIFKTGSYVAFRNGRVRSVSQKP
jgi:hypothetical protein